MANRRKFLAGMGTVGTVIIAGCSEGDLDNGIEEAETNGDDEVIEEEASEEDAETETSETPFFESVDIFTDRQLPFINGEVVNPTDETVGLRVEGRIFNEDEEELDQESTTVTLDPSTNAPIPVIFEPEGYSNSDIGEYKIILNAAEDTIDTQEEEIQSSSDATTEPVTEIIQFESVVGEDTSTDSELDRISASLRLASGAVGVNLSEATYTLVLDNEADVISGDPSEKVSYEVVQESDDGVEDDEGNFVLTNQGDRVEVSFDLRAVENVNSLEASEQFTIGIQPPSGGSSFSLVRAPRVVEEGESYIL